MLDGGSLDQYRELTRKLLQQSSKATGIAQFVAQLTCYQQPAANEAEVLLSAALEKGIEDMTPIFDSIQIKLIFDRPQRERLVMMSPVRLRQFVLHILDVVRMVSATEDVIHLELVLKNSRMKLQVRRESGPGTSSRTVTSSGENSGNRALALAEAIVSSAQGKFTASLEPLSISAEFPTARQRETRYWQKGPDVPISSRAVNALH